MKKQVLSLLALAVLVSGCVSLGDHQVAVLRDPHVGHLVQCTPDNKNFFKYIGIGQSTDACVEFYMRRGYIPVTKHAPPKYNF